MEENTMEQLTTFLATYGILVFIISITLLYFKWYFIKTAVEAGMKAAIKDFVENSGLFDIIDYEEEDIS
jgi:hypothetical protein